MRGLRKAPNAWWMRSRAASVVERFRSVSVVVETADREQLSCAVEVVAQHQTDGTPSQEALGVSANVEQLVTPGSVGSLIARYWRSRGWDAGTALDLGGGVPLIPGRRWWGLSPRSSTWVRLGVDVEDPEVWPMQRTTSTRVRTVRPIQVRKSRSSVRTPEIMMPPSPPASILACPALALMYTSSCASRGSLLRAERVDRAEAADADLELLQPEIDGIGSFNRFRSQRRNHVSGSIAGPPPWRRPGPSGKAASQLSGFRVAAPYR